MARVFLSYATADYERATTVFGWLVAEGHDVFFDRDVRDGIPAGDDWRQRLNTELNRVDAVVCLLTRAYLRSMWCISEAAVVWSRGCLIIPLRAERDVTHPLIDNQQYTSDEPAIAKAQVVARLRQLDAGGRGEWHDGDNPYPGLAAFTAKLTNLYFGRSREKRELSARVRSGARGGVIAVTGPSGCGKSSLLRAGLLPAMATDSGWLVVDAWSPTDAPVSALAKALVATAHRLELGWSLDHVRHKLDDDRGLRELTDELLIAGHGQRVLLPIDQAEELFAARVEPGARAQLAKLLTAAVSGEVRVVLTVRSEYLDELSKLLPLPDGSIDTYLLGPLASEMLRQAIEAPARVAGLRLAPELSARLMTDTESGDALPLLAFTLQQLAEGLSRGDALTVDAYDRLGGVHAVLAAKADAALAAAARASNLTDGAILAGLVRLVDVDVDGRRIRRTVAQTDLTESMRAAVAVFVENRLLMADGSHVRFIHEALLTAWRRLARTIEEHSTVLRAARTVEQAAADWTAAGRAAGYLWDRERFAVASLDLGQGADIGSAVALGADARDFLDATKTRIDRDRRRSWFRRASVTVGLSVLLVATLVAAAIAAMQANTARRERDAATVQELIARADSVRLTDPKLALRLGLAAQSLGATHETTANLMHTLTMNNYAATLTGSPNTVRTVAFSPDGRILAQGDIDGHTLRLWDVSDRENPRLLGTPLTDPTNSMLAFAFSPNGAVLATAGRNQAILWNMADPARPVKLRTLPPSSRPLVDQAGGFGVAFSPNGDLLAGTFDGAVTLWDVRRPDMPTLLGSPLATYGAPGFGGIAFSPSGRYLADIVSGSVFDRIQLWNVSSPSRPVLAWSTSSDTSVITSLAFDPQHDILATTSKDRYHPPPHNDSIALWNVADPAKVVPLATLHTGQTGDILQLAFSADGTTMATASPDKTVIVWDVRDPTQPRQIGNPLTDHDNAVDALAFAPTDGTLATGSYDDTVRLWTRDNPIQPVAEPDPVLDYPTNTMDPSLPQPMVAFSSNSRTLATIPNQGPTRLWDISNPARPRGPAELPSSSGLITTLTFRPSGPVLATGGGVDAHARIQLWDVSDALRPRPLTRPLTGYRGDLETLHFSTDGNTLWSADLYWDLIRWDTTDPTHPHQTAAVGPDRLHFDGIPTFRPDNRAIAAVVGNQSAVLNDISDPQHIQLRPSVLADNATNAVAFGPDGTLIATGGDDVLLWDVSTASQPRPYGFALGAGHDVWSLAISADASTLAVGNGDGSITLWDISDPTRPFQLGAPLTGHPSTADGLAFSPDGRLLASIDSSGKVLLWNLSALQNVQGHLVADACARAMRGFTPDEWTRYVGTTQPYRQTCPR